MLWRIALLFLLLAPSAAAQPAVPALRDIEICASREINNGLADIDEASCRPSRTLAHIITTNKAIWVRGRIAVDSALSRAGPVGLYTGALASREIWWNGELTDHIGHSGTSPETEQPGDLDAVSWIPPDKIRPDNAVAIRYSSFHLPIGVGSPLHYVQAGNMNGTGRAMLRTYGLSLAATGALVIAAIFFGVAFIWNRRVLGSLFISMMSAFAVGQLWLEAMRGLMSYPYPVQVWRLLGIAVLAFAFALSLTAYVGSRFAPKRWRTYVAAAAVAGLALIPIMPGFDGITVGLILGPAVVALVAAIQGAASRIPGAMITALGLLVFLALIAVQAPSFLDQTFYFAISVLVAVLFVDQLRELRRAREAEELANRRATLLELELLKRRIAPHFLMNTLNALAEWVESDPKAGVKMIEALAGEFRLLSQVSDRPMIPLAEEIALCRRHLEVMSFRVDRPFSLAVKGVDEAMEVPPGVLHTLVENAFTHGRFVQGGEFELVSETDKDGVKLALLTPPAQRADVAKTPRGEGLAYVRRRLDAAFGPQARLESGAAGNGWRTVLTIPRGAAA